MTVHVVIGLYGMIMNDLTLWTDKEAAMAKARELCENYEVEPVDDSSYKDREGLFFATDGQAENEVHLYFDQPLEGIIGRTKGLHEIRSASMCKIKVLGDPKTKDERLSQFYYPAQEYDWCEYAGNCGECPHPREVMADG